MVTTANELLRDALVRRQIYLQRYGNGLSAEIIGLLDKTERAVRLELMDRYADIAGKDFSASTTKRLETLADSLAKIRQDAFDGATDKWETNLRQLAVAEADYVNSAIKDYSPVVLDTALPSVELLGSLIDTQPLQGRVLKDWASRLADADAERISDALKIGVAQGETTDQVVRRIIGTRALDGADGVLEVTRRDVVSITQTAVATISGEARQALYAANDDIIQEEVYTATLDSSTTEECAALDGERFPVGEGPQPPIHWNCRSTRVPTLDGKVIGDRPATAATEDELEGLSGKERADRVAELTGTVPASTTYADFLANQSESFQAEVLGKTRAGLFRDGKLTLDKFVNNNGRTYTLDQLKTLHPSAFSD